MQHTGCELEKTISSSNSIFSNADEELRNVREIGEKNLEAISLRQNKIFSAFHNQENRKREENERAVKECFLLQKQWTSDQLEYLSNKQQLENVNRSIHDLELQVANLHKQNQELEVNLQYLSEGSSKGSVELNSKLQAFKKATEYINGILNIKVEVEESSIENVNWFKVIFGKKGGFSYPIRFCFNKHNDGIIDFDAGTLIDKETKTLLLSKVKETGDLPSLCFTLREYISKK